MVLQPTMNLQVFFQSSALDKEFGRGVQTRHSRERHTSGSDKRRTRLTNCKVVYSYLKIIEGTDLQVVPSIILVRKTRIKDL